MAKVKNSIWRFFASVKLALTALIVLAATSIIGTLIKQAQEPSYYVQTFGANLARFFEVTGISNMYSSWWFIALLCLFAVNLVVCSIERLPRVWRLMTADNLQIDAKQLETMRFTHRTSSALPVSATVERIRSMLIGEGWKNTRQLTGPDSTLLFAHKGAWTRLGVYVVHLSILIILIGAVTGKIFGYKAYVFLPEGVATDKVFLQKNQQPIPLGFELQCDRFEQTLYPNGMLKEFRTDLTVLDQQGTPSYHKSIIVNDPLSYRGLTFYEVDYFPMAEFFVTLRSRSSGQEQEFLVPPEKDIAWKANNISFRIEEVKQDGEGALQQAKIRFSADDGAGLSIFWLQNNGTETIRQKDQEFTFSIRQRHSVLLLVTKDPGVRVVYTGCILMLFGLAIVFFLYHRRIWVRITPGSVQDSSILLSGASNKNKSAFEVVFRHLAERLG